MDSFSYLYQITRLNVIRYDPNSECADVYPQGPFPAEDLSGLDYGELIPEDPSRIHLVKEGSGLLFLTGLRDGQWYFIGPFITETERPDFSARRFSRRNRMPVLSDEQIDAYLIAAGLYFRHGSPETGRRPSRTVETHNPAVADDRSIDYGRIEFMYHMEAEIRDAIASGDRQRVLAIGDLGTDTDNSFGHRLPSNPFRVQKNMAIVMNTIGRHAAERGGLPPYLLHMISDEYAVKIEHSRNHEDLADLQREMILGYCDAVRHYGLGNHSAAVVRVCNYIIQHLGQRIRLEELAEIAAYSPQYLSRRFREETGMTISAYIREKRIIEAKWLLAHSDQSITDVALNLGFEDLNYFSRTFAREEGIPPSEFRRTRWKGAFDGLPIRNS
jgi:two-component system response regulator YesN